MQKIIDETLGANTKRPATRAPLSCAARRSFSGYQREYGIGADPGGFPGARYYWLHSLAHLLMNAMSLECGYATASLSEHIYCAPATVADAHGGRSHSHRHERRRRHPRRSRGTKPTRPPPPAACVPGALRSPDDERAIDDLVRLFTGLSHGDLRAPLSRVLTLAGYSFDHGERMFEPLHRSMCERNVAVRLFVDVQQLHERLEQALQEQTLITSANFTDRGQSRNFEVGVLIRDPLFAQSLEQQWFKPGEHERGGTLGDLIR